MIRVGVLGATGMVGQHYISLLQNHPWFNLTLVAASVRSYGKGYRDAIEEWFPEGPLEVDMPLGRAEEADECDLVFSCMEGGEELEEALAEKGVVVISHNASHRKKKGVPIIIP